MACVPRGNANGTFNASEVPTSDRKCIPLLTGVETIYANPAH